MNKKLDRAFGSLVRKKRESLMLSQVELARKLDCPQPTVSRLEHGQHSVALPELLSLAQALKTSVSDLLEEFENALGAPAATIKLNPKESPPSFSPVFHAALADEEAALSQLAAHGVRFLGGPRPAVFKLSLEETLLVALKHAHDPRVFEVLPSLLVMHAQNLDWNKLTSGTFALHLQNLLGAAVAAALQMKKLSERVSGQTWEFLQEVHDRLTEARLDREEVLGPKPKTQEALRFLAKRTPPWMRFWHVLGSADAESFRRHLPR